MTCFRLLLPLLLLALPAAGQEWRPLEICLDNQTSFPLRFVATDAVTDLSLGNRFAPGNVAMPRSRGCAPGFAGPSVVVEVWRLEGPLECVVRQPVSGRRLTITARTLVANSASCFAG